MTDEAIDRKLRSVKRLQSEAVPFIAWLPVIETQSESLRRTAEEVVRRMIALAVVATYADDPDPVQLSALIEWLGARGFFTSEEKAFLDNPAPPDHERTQLVWRIECVWVLLWALSFKQDLGRPDKACDVSEAIDVLRDLGTEGLMEQALLRPQSELLDAADLIYRYHWAVRDACINGRDIPAGLDPGVVMERHYALNWLIGYPGQDWDEISTET